MKRKASPKQPVPGSGSTFSWNLVSQGLEPGPDLSGELRSRIDRLSLLLDQFPPGQVHLLVNFARQEGAPPFETRLDLKLPITVLHAHDKGSDLSETLRHSFFVLERQLEALRGDLRGKRRWESPESTPSGPNQPPPVFGKPMKKGPKTPGDLLRNFIFRHYHRLLLDASRRVDSLEAEAEIPAGTIDAQEVLDEVTRICLESPDKKPPELTYELWLFRLIREELDREYRDWVSTYRNRVELPGGAAAEEEMSQMMQDALPGDRDPGEASSENEYSDPLNPPPDLLLEESDLAGEVLKQVHSWNKRDREIFHLHFLDGFDAVETAMVEKMEVGEVEKTIARLQRRLRNILREAAG